MARRKPPREAPEVAVQRLVEAAGVKLVRRGASLVGRCPCHDDTGVALTVDLKANTWSCPTCRAGGGPIEWVMRAEGVSRRHALELLAEGLPTHGAAGKVKRTSVPRLAAPVNLDADDQGLLQGVVDFYHSTLKQNADALAYLDSRGIHSAEAVGRFRLGLSNRTLGLRLPAKNRKLGAELRGRLTKLGVYRKTGREHMAGSLVIPIFGVGGEVAQVYGRKTTPNLRAGTELHVWLPGGPRGVWNREALVASKTIILAASLIDALTFWCAGHRNVTSLLAHDLHDDLLAAFKENSTKAVLLAFRRDREGEKKAEAVAAKLLATGMGCYSVQFPAGQDANDFARAADDPARALGRVLRSAVWLGKGKAPEVEVEAVVVVEKGAAVAARTQQEAAVAPLRAQPASEMGMAPDAAQDGAAEAVAESASPEPPAPASPEVPTEQHENEVVIRLGERRYRVRGREPKRSRSAILARWLRPLWGSPVTSDESRRGRPENTSVTSSSTA